MKIRLHEYHLTYRLGKGVRQGAILKVEFPDGTTGYADCHPWEELGDLSLNQQLTLLSKGVLTRLTARSFHFAKIDARARKKGISLFSGLEIPKSHVLMRSPFEEIPEGYSRIKIKVGRDPLKEIPRLVQIFRSLPRNVQIRLDFNNQLNKNDFETYLISIREWISLIDFIEDPFQYKKSSWNELSKKYSILFACDHKSDELIDAHSIAIIKPAVQDEEAFIDCGRCIFTSYLDHPLGQLCAGYVAAKSTQEYCGLLTHLNYVDNAFSETLSIENEKLIPPEGGTGFGFDYLLQKIDWKELR